MSLPKRFPDRDEIASVRAEAELLEPGAEADDKRRVAGRVLARREMGKLVFLDLVDRVGRIQLLCDTTPHAASIDVDLGDIVGVTGVAGPGKARRAFDRRRRSSSCSPRSARPLPDTFHGLTDVEQRYRTPLPRSVDERGIPPARSSRDAGSSPRSGRTSTARDSSRSRRPSCSRVTGAGSPSRSSLTRTSSIRISISVSPTSSI